MLENVFPLAEMKMRFHFPMLLRRANEFHNEMAFLHKIDKFNQKDLCRKPMRINPEACHVRTADGSSDHGRR